ncbi:MAG: HAD family hydrolase [Chloroflexi bacterium]|nr:HAD family hydrolase [Chloroflexota bacterium]
MNACDTILFDFGHTLVDLRASDDALRQVYAGIRARLLSLGHHTLPSVDDMVAVVAKRIDQLINDSYVGPNVEELDIVDLFDAVYREVGVALHKDELRDIVVMEHQALSSAMTPADNVREVLRALKGLGLRMGVVSNMTNLPEMMVRDLERMRILQYFDVTVFSSETRVRKPDKRIYLAALNVIQSIPEKTVFVGDRIKEDVLGPQALGMKAVLTHQFRQEQLNGSRPEKVILDLAEMLDFVKLVGST